MAEAKTFRVGLWLIIGKLGAKFLPAIFKVFAVLLKTKGGLAALSFAGYSAMFTWQFALILMISLGIHEAGHVWAMKRCGIPTRGFYFIPFVGGAAVPDRAWHTQREHLYVALMGPVWGTFCALFAACLYLATGQVLWAGVGAWIAVVNLINLVPVYPLDGGRVLHSVTLPTESRMQRIVFLTLMVGMIGVVAWNGIYLFAVIGVVGLLELFTEDRIARERVAHARSRQGRLEVSRSLVDNISEQAPEACSRVRARLPKPSGWIDHIGRNGLSATRTRNRVAYRIIHELIVDNELIDEGQTARAPVQVEGSLLKETSLGNVEVMVRIELMRLYAMVLLDMQLIERKIEEDKTKVLQSLRWNERLLGLFAWFVLSMSLAGIVIVLGGVDGAGPALQALQ